jgi:translation initiation factor IF-1
MSDGHDAVAHLLDTYHPDIRGNQGDRISVMVLDYMTKGRGLIYHFTSPFSSNFKNVRL